MMQLYAMFKENRWHHFREDRDKLQKQFNKTTLPVDKF